MHVPAVNGCRAWTMLAALPDALLAHGRLSPLAPLLPGALPASPSRDERSHCREGVLHARLSQSRV